MEGGTEASSRTSPAFRATLIAQSYAACHGSSILLLDESQERQEEGRVVLGARCIVGNEEVDWWRQRGLRVGPLP